MIVLPRRLGVSVIIGVAGAGQEIRTRPCDLVKIGYWRGFPGIDRGSTGARRVSLLDCRQARVTRRNSA
jgi:Zn-dependent alcohol dehydrogenase